MVVLGGLVLTTLVVLTCVSILGRAFDTLGHADWLVAAAPGVARLLAASAPVPGDFELVEAGIAFAIFAFLPICQLQRGHATVDVFTRFLPTKLQAMLVAFWEVALAAVIVLIAWRLYVGLDGKRGNGETTFILQFPVWWAYAASFVAAVVAALTALYCAASVLLDLFRDPRRVMAASGTARESETVDAGSDVSP